MIRQWFAQRGGYLIGEIAGPYRYDKSIDPEDAQYRPVRWQGEVGRDLLSVESRNSLGSISTLLRIPTEVAAELDLETQQLVPLKRIFVPAWS